VAEIEARILQESSSRIPVRAIESLTGVQRVFHRSPGENASDLASKAAKKALTTSNVNAHEIDLLIFASASQDLIEPATSHIISNNLGTTCPVFDIKNACNSFLNGLQVADSFIKSGTYKTVLVVTGEAPSTSIRWNCKNKAEFVTSFPGYSMSDSGGAVILRAVESDTPTGILSITMSANSDMWEIGTLGTGGSRSPRDVETNYFNMDGAALFEAFKTVGCDMLYKQIDEGAINWDDYAAIGMHQVAKLYNEMLIDTLSLPAHKTIETITQYGNLASNSFPLQLETALLEGRVKEGDKFAFIGLGGGISTGFGAFQL
jgi:3-oxoacyl-[acyl-carrier-protein] synthase-3